MIEQYKIEAIRTNRTEALSPSVRVFDHFCRNSKRVGGVESGWRGNARDGSSVLLLRRDVVIVGSGTMLVGTVGGCAGLLGLGGKGGRRVGVVEGTGSLCEGDSED